MKRVAIVVSRRAAREIDDAATWWAARGWPTLIDDAIAAVLARLSAFPEMAPKIAIRGKRSATRRASVEHGYHLYYEYDARAERILLRCFWHERRQEPRL